MLENRSTLETGRWTVLILIVLLALTAGTVASTVGVAAQSGNATGSNQSQASSGAAVSIAENQTSPNELELKSVTLPENGYIVVQNDTNVSSASGVVAHTQYVRPGQFEDVVIAINETVMNGTTLRVAVHNDTNGNEKFDFVNSSGQEDSPVVGADGTPISDMARVSGNASESNASAETTTITTSSAQTAANRTNATSTASPTATPSTSGSESRYAGVRPGSTPAQSGSPATTPTATPTPAATSTFTTDRSHPPNETANASVGGGPGGGESGGSGSGVSASESGGIGGIAGLSPMMLLLGGAMIVLALGEMVVFARASSRQFRIPGFLAGLRSLSEIIPRGQSEQCEEDGAAENGETHCEDGDQPLLTAIRQVGDDRASTLREAGFESVEDVATASQSALTEVEGIGGARGEAIAESANGLLDGESSTVDDAPADVAEDGNTHIGVDEAAASEAVRENDEGQTSVVANARTSLAKVARRVYGHTRMLFDRRVLEPRAYGATDDWTALTFDCSDLDDSGPVRELLEETVYIGEVPVEITGEATDRPERRLSAESSVRVPREGIEQVEQAAQADNPEAKRTVTLLRRALHAEEERAIRGSSG